MRDVAIVSFAQSEPHQRSVEKLNEVEMLMPVTRAALDQVDLTIQDIGFTCSGSTDYLAGIGVLLRVDPRRRRPLAADPGVARRDGRCLGALRGLGQAPDRRDRHRLRLRLLQVVARRPAHRAHPPARPLHRGPAVARLGQHRRPSGAGGPRRRHRHPEADGRGGRTQPARRAGQQPQRPAALRPLARPTWRPSPTTSACCAAPTARRSPTAPPPSCWPPATGPASCPTAPRGSVASTTASTRWPSGCATSPTCRPPASRPRRPASPTPPSTSGSCTPRSPTTSCCSGGRSGCPTTRSSTRPAARCRPTPCSPPGCSASARPRPASSSGQANRAVAHATQGPALQQNLVAVLEGDA